MLISFWIAYFYRAKKSSLYINGFEDRAEIYYNLAHKIIVF